MNMRGTEEGNINQYLADTISNVFTNVYTADVKGSTNRELFASNSDNMISVMKDNVLAMGKENAELTNMMEQVSVEMQKYTPGNYLMTDDKAPVELLGMRVIDALIQDEVSYYKDIFDKEGLQGILNAM